MDRAERLERLALRISKAEEKVEQQKLRVASLENRKRHTAAALARETLAVMVDFLEALRVQYSLLVETARVLEEARQLKAQARANHGFVCEVLSAPTYSGEQVEPSEQVAVDVTPS